MWCHNRLSQMALAVAMVLGLIATNAAAEKENKIAVVDMQRALNECDAGKRAKDQVKAKFEKAQEQLKRQRDELDHRQEEFEKKSSVLREEERRDQAKDLETRTLEFRRKSEDLQRDLKRTDAELTQGIVERIYEIVRDYGQQHAYTLVFEASSGALIYADKSIDVTDEIIKLTNASPIKESSGRRSGDD